jgi:hypothetical protein
MSFKILLLAPDADASWPEKIRRAVPGVVVNPTFATRGIEAAKLEVFHGVRSKGRHHTGRCHGAATSTEAILGDG